MERQTTFMDAKMQYSEDINSPQLIYSFNIIPIKIPARVSAKTNKIYSQI